MYNGYLIDLDGIAYLGENVIPSCRDFINRCVEEKIKFCFVTNNSTRTTKEVYEHLKRIGYKVNQENIITSSEVTAKYIKKENPLANVYLIGMNGIKTEFEKNKISMVSKNADYVVVGLDFNINYEKVSIACEEVFNGAKFISTNSDLRLSRTNGITPGNGSLTKVIELVTNVEPIYMGKPQIEMLEYGLEKLNLPKEEVAMIGDNYFTDIMGAHNFGMDSIFVETGVMKIQDLEAFTKQPTIIVRDLSQLKIK
ncbi:HAD-IIA family hydrolase [Mycoplasmatota bacterium]|nr:HAD-IIA family hydrolase [Mycoplasmatota bacterium]